MRTELIIIVLSCKDCNCKSTMIAPHAGLYIYQHCNNNNARHHHPSKSVVLCQIACQKERAIEKSKKEQQSAAGRRQRAHTRVSLDAHVDAHPDPEGNGAVAYYTEEPNLWKTILRCKATLTVAKPRELTGGQRHDTRRATEMAHQKILETLVESDDRLECAAGLRSVLLPATPILSFYEATESTPISCEPWQWFQKNALAWTKISPSVFWPSTEPPFDVSLHPLSSVGNFKALINKHNGTPPSKQHLYFNGEHLKHGYVRHSGIESFDIVTLVPKLAIYGDRGLRQDEDQDDDELVQIIFLSAKAAQLASNISCRHNVWKRECVTWLHSRGSESSLITSSRRSTVSFRYAFSSLISSYRAQFLIILHMSFFGYLTWAFNPSICLSKIVSSTNAIWALVSVICLLYSSPLLLAPFRFFIFLQMAYPCR